MRNCSHTRELPLTPPTPHPLKKGVTCCIVILISVINRQILRQSEKWEKIH